MVMTGFSALNLQTIGENRVNTLPISQVDSVVDSATKGDFSTDQSLSKEEVHFASIFQD